MISLPSQGILMDIWADGLCELRGILKSETGALNGEHWRYFGAKPSTLIAREHSSTYHCTTLVHVIPETHNN